MYSAFTPGEMKLDVFMKWLRYAEDCPPTTLWYLLSGRNLNDGELREIKTDADIETMISELGSTTDLQLYADGPIEEFYFMNPLNHRKPPVGSMKLQTCSEYVADGVEILTQEDITEDDFFPHVDDCEPEKETDGPGKNIYDTIDDDDPTYNVVNSDYESEDLELVREDAENYLESEPISETVTMFKDVKDIKDVKFSIGLTFINKVQAVDAIRDYAVAGGYKIRFKKNDRKRVRAKCGDGCKWEILISKVGRDIYWQVKTLISGHTCSRSITNPNASKKWLVKHMIPVLMRDYSMSTIKVVEYVKHNLYVEITKNMAWRVRVACFDVIHGDYKQQYARIRDYGVEIKRSNPGASVYLQTTLLHPQSSRNPMFLVILDVIPPQDQNVEGSQSTTQAHVEDATTEPSIYLPESACADLPLSENISRIQVVPATTMIVPSPIVNSVNLPTRRDNGKSNRTGRDGERMVVSTQ
ncbi:hypothetical protein ACFE04_021510 [Oxalis oulophora]